MHLRKIVTIVLLTLFIASKPCTAGSIKGVAGNLENLPCNLLAKIQKEYSALENSLSKKTTKYLNKMQLQEKMLQREVANADSAYIPQECGDSIYSDFAANLSQRESSLVRSKFPVVRLNKDNPYLDTLSTFLASLQKYKRVEDKVKGPTEAFGMLKSKFNETDKMLFQKFMRDNSQLSLVYKLQNSSYTDADTLPQVEESINFSIPGVCKGYSFIHVIIPAVEISSKEKNTHAFTLPAKKRTQLLQVKGNILYDVNYRSRIDTPYAEKNIYQHSLQTRLDFIYKEQYPFKIYITAHFSNSPLFRNYTELNFGYRQADFAQLLKQRIIKVAESYILSRTNQLDSLRQLIDLQKSKITSLSQVLQKPDIRQKLVEERERQLFGNGTEKSIGDVTVGNTELQDALIQSREFKFPTFFEKKLRDRLAPKNSRSDKERFYSYNDSLDEKKKMLDNLITELDKTQKLYSNLKSVQQFNQDNWKNEIYKAKDANLLTEKLHELQIPDTILPRGYKTLYSIQSFNVGRSMVNYSELSVKNISITGIQAEYNPHYYYAFAAGKVDYRFRDYIIPDHSRSDQYLALLRFGKGTKNGNHIIFTYYTGKRQFFNSSVAMRSTDLIPAYNLAGITVEGLYKPNKNISLILELAKSSLPYYSPDSLQKKNWMNSVMRFKDVSNEAYSVSLNSYFPKTQTRFSGDVRYTGANFQSFSTFTTGASQTKWSARVDQPFFKKKLTIFSSLQQNDYSNPFVTTTYKSSSVLASLQATLRMKKWPFLSIGYYPSYQLTKINNDNYTENRYYTLVANSGYYYQVRSVQLSSYIVFSKFYNGASDSGFVYFNSKNLLISQTAVIKDVTFGLNASVSVNTGYAIYTIENNAQLTISSLLSIGGGLKLINQTLLNDLLWGYSGNIRLNVKKLGEIQLMFDKGFIPYLDRKLATNSMGRVTYFKTF